jgi:hypothetical protein
MTIGTVLGVGENEIGLSLFPRLHAFGNLRSKPFGGGHLALRGIRLELVIRLVDYRPEGILEVDVAVAQMFQFPGAEPAA